jgi:hypothetical protein
MLFEMRQRKQTTINKGLTFDKLSSVVQDISETHQPQQAIWKFPLFLESKEGDYNQEIKKDSKPTCWNPHISVSSPNISVRRMRIKRVITRTVL